MKLEELYQKKGELSFQIQVAQAKLRAIDEELLKYVNNDIPIEKKADGSNG